MSKLPEKSKNALAVKSVAVDLYGGKAKSIDIKRKIVELPEVKNALSPVEFKIFSASSRKLISEATSQELTKSFSDMFGFIAMDIGYNRPSNQNEWTYICSRLVGILVDYFPNTSIADVKLAFELLVVGELDDFLPRDSKGNPDKNHYQNFNAEYLSKILKAYLKKQNAIVFKAYKYLPEPVREVTETEKEFYRRQIFYDLAFCYLQFKYTGRYPKAVNELSEGLFYEKLLEMGYAHGLEVTDDDKADSLAFFVFTSRGNRYENQSIVRSGVDHEKVKGRAKIMARKKELKRVFTEMAKEEIQPFQIINYIKNRK